MNAKRRWIFLRGLIRWKAHWVDFVSEFQTAFPNDEIILLDLPGFGEFNDSTGFWSLEKIVDFLDEKVDWSKGPYSIFAVSLGAMVAAHWAEKRKGQISQLVLVNTSDKRSRISERLKIQNWSRLFSNFFLFDSEKLERTVLEISSNSPEKRTLAFPLYVNAFQQKPFKRLAFVKQIFVGSQTRFPDRAPVPTLFLNSIRDRLVNPVCTERIAQLWKCELVSNPVAGHDLTLDDAGWVIKRLQALNPIGL